MRIFFERSGGFMGLNINTAVDTQALPDTDRQVESPDWQDQTSTTYTYAADCVAERFVCVTCRWYHVHGDGRRSVLSYWKVCAVLCFVGRLEWRFASGKVS